MGDINNLEQRNDDISACFYGVNSIVDTLSEQAKLAPSGVIAAIDSEDIQEIKNLYADMQIEEVREVALSKLQVIRENGTSECIKERL